MRNSRPPRRGRSPFNMASGIVTAVPLAILLIVLAFLMHNWFG